MAVATENAGMAALAQIFAPQRLGLLLVGAAMVAVVVGAWLWSQTPDYRVLYANVSDRDGGAIVTALQQMNVPYKFAEGGGAILVPAQQVHEVRLRLASQGLPKGTLSGFELMENPKLGATHFLEQVNYQRALEGELARSIQSVSAVQAARVHLALSKPSVFVREQQKPTASVLLNLHPGRTLEPGQVSAIMHLVSASVPDLPLKNVTVVDQNGSLLSQQATNGPAAGGLDPTQLKYLHEMESGYIKRIESILAPIVGAENIRAQVTADVDFSQSERAEEIYRPNQNPAEATVRSQQLSESLTPGTGQAAGVPGALTNQPPVQPTAPITGAPAAAAAPGAPSAQGAPGAATTATNAAALNSRKDSTVNYEVDKTIRHVRQPVGTIKRLSVAVVVNHRKETGADGKVSYKPLTPEEMTQITDLVKETMGFNSARGDSLNVANSPFAVPERTVIADLPLWKNPATLDWALTIGRYLLAAGIALYLILGVLRPLSRSIAKWRPPAPPAETGGEQPATATIAYEQKLALAKDIAKQEPKLVANVVKAWVSNG